MASLQHLKKRLSGIKNIKQITAAMELVAAAKMRKAQEVALGSRAYAVAALEILANMIQALSRGELAESTEGAELNYPLTAKRVVKKTAILLVLSDKGLVGSFNSNVIRRFEKYCKEEGIDRLADHSELAFVIVGQKGAEYITKKGGNIEKIFTNFSDVMELGDVTELATLLADGYAAGKWDRVVAFTTNFVSALKQETIVAELLPLSVEKIRQAVEDIIPETGRYAELKTKIVTGRSAKPIDYIIEPSPVEVIAELLPALFQMQVYHLALEANASEHSARRMAMKNATDNAKDIINDLTLLFNRSRQEAITKELTEITGTVAAIK